MEVFAVAAEESVGVQVVANVGSDCLAQGSLGVGYVIGTDSRLSWSLFGIYSDDENPGRWGIHMGVGRTLVRSVSDRFYSSNSPIGPYFVALIHGRLHVEGLELSVERP